MIIKSKLKEYYLNIENNFSFIPKLAELKNTMFVIDKNLYSIYEKELFEAIPHDMIIIIEALETNKNIDTVLQICERVTSITAKRNAHLVSFGGGIIQDITGFAANILYRGIKWTYVPTTLLAACDSCIGGKTSLNYKNYKNLFGTFYPPDEIYICPDFFNTLSEHDFNSGLGEAVKFSIMSGKVGLDSIERDIDLLLAREKQTLNRYLDNSLDFKKKYIEEDEFDKGKRIYLNFAHTFGHAFETVSNYVIPHGTAVAMGMIIANRISLQRGLLGEELVSRSEKVLKRIINVDFTSFNFNLDLFIDAIRKDKKQTTSEISAILLDQELRLVVFKDIKQKEITDAIEKLYSCLDVEVLTR